jgi:hypothetical protein
MNYEFPLRASKEYVCPQDAGPAWRAAYEAGFDMAELDDNLKLSPWERLQKNDRLLADQRKRENFLKIFGSGVKLIHLSKWQS